VPVIRRGTAFRRLPIQPGRREAPSTQKLPSSHERPSRTYGGGSELIAGRQSQNVAELWQMPGRQQPQGKASLPVNTNISKKRDPDRRPSSGSYFNPGNSRQSCGTPDDSTMRDEVDLVGREDVRQLRHLPQDCPAKISAKFNIRAVARLPG
jgi:hypothetical protein